MICCAFNIEIWKVIYKNLEVFEMNKDMKKEVLDGVRDLLKKRFPNDRIVSHRFITEDKGQYIIDFGLVS
ncbi:hypothetical protein DH09_00680 (plasmid) [Bacillaceae bacterium JMAK1]|nr:hypothetical protein DH09_00680 [Bacillaceae bacterium JMAK1]